MTRITAIVATCVLAVCIGVGIAIGQHAKVRSYVSPQSAVDELMSSIRADDTQQIQAIFGAEGYDMIHSGDAVADKDARQRFLAAYRTRSMLVADGAGRIVLQVGADAWRFPIPLVKGPDGWFFDTTAGRDELRARRIGRNELATIAVAKAYVDAQREYAKLERDDAMREYAQKFISSKGNKDGLYWAAKSGEPESPLGRLVTPTPKRVDMRRAPIPLRSRSTAITFGY